MNKFLVFVFSASLLCACSEPDAAVVSKLNTIDSLQTVLTELEENLKPYAGSALADEASEVKELHNFLENNYPDLEDRTFWINKMNPTRRVYKSVGAFARKQSEMQTELPYTQKQLASLRNSIVDGKLNQQQQEDYLAVEAKAVNDMHSVFMAYEPEAKVCLAIWDTLGPVMYAIKSDLDTLSVKDNKMQ